MSLLVCDFDDFGCNHVISDVCQSHDCRDALDKLHWANLNFKVTLFAVPGEMTMELCEWCKSNGAWVELALHGFYHKDNWECSKMTYDEFDNHMNEFKDMIRTYFGRGFKAPGWQISDDIYRWLKDNDMWVADQSYNNDRRPDDLKSYVISDETPHWHGHCWDCVGNGIYETFSQLKDTVTNATEFKFISEVV